MLGFAFLSHGEQLFSAAPHADQNEAPARAINIPGKRTRLASVNTNANWFHHPLGSLAATTILNLVDDVTVTGVLEHATATGPGKILLQGRVAGENGSYFLFASESNVVSGSIFIPNRGSWKIEYVGNGLHRVTEQDSAQLPACGVDLSQTSLPSPDARAAAPIAAESASSGGATFTIVDVLVLYTSQSRDGAGGELAMDTMIDLAVAEANLTFQKSGVDMVLRLAGKAKVSYEESGNITLDLSRMINPADGYLDEAVSLRAACDADLVCLLVENSDGPSGVATVTANRTNAFSVVQRPWAVGSYVFAHELSHNFGCQHDRANANTPGVYAYSYGWVFQANSSTYGTVMSYPGQRIPHFSNPSVDFLGVPTGIASGANAANNAQTLRSTMQTVSAFSGQATTTRAPGVTLTSPANKSTIDTGTGIILNAGVTAGTAPVSRVDFYQDGTLVGSSDGPLFACELTNSSYGDFVLTARAVDAIGASTLSSPVTVYARYLNDSFALRRPLSGTDVRVNVGNFGATLEPGEPAPFAQADATVWFTWTAPADGTVLFSLFAHDFPAFVAVYTGNNLTNLQFISGSPDGRPTAFAIRQGVTYQIAIGGYDNSTDSGHATLQWQEFLPISNDNLANALPIPGTNYHVFANNVMATTEPGEPSHDSYAAGHSVWWRWTAPTNGVASISISSNPAVTLVVYLGDSFANLTRVVGSNPQLEFSAAAGKTYEIAADSVDGGYGSFSLDLAFRPDVPPPPNDNFADSILLTGNNTRVTASNIGATRELGEPGIPGDYNAGSGQTVWWSWTALATGYLTVDPGRDDAYLAAYTGDVITNLVNVGASFGKLSIPVVAGTTYHLLLDSSGNPFSTTLALDFVLSINDLANDNFTNRAVLTGTPAQVYQYNGGATKEPGEPNHGNNPGGQSLWYTWTSTFNGTALVKVESQGELFYSLLGVYTGNDLASLHSIGQGSSQVQVTVTNGMTLQIAVDGYNGFYGFLGAVAHYILTIQGPPPNDDFSKRQIVAGTNVLLASSSLFATKETGEPNHGLQVGGTSVWYSWTAPGNGGVKINVTGLPSVLMGVYTGNELTNLMPIQSTSVIPLDFNVTAGATCQIAIDSENGSSGGPFLFSLAFEPTVVRPANDDFASRNPVAGLENIVGSNTNATREYREPYHGGLAGNKSVWWEWTSPVTGRITIDSGGGTINNIAVYSGTQLNNLVVLACSPIFPGRPVSFDAVTGRKYEIAVDAFEGNGGAAYGTVDLALSFQPAPANDNFADRLFINGGHVSISLDSTGASREPGEPVHGVNGHHSLWYSWTASTNGTVAVQTFATNLAPAIAAYTGTSLNGLQQLMSSAGGYNASGSFAVAAGQTYQIAVDTMDDQFGAFVFELNFFPRPVNDNWSDRLPLAGTVMHLVACNVGATREPGEAGDFFPGASIPGTNSIWWTWTAPASGTLMVSGTSTFSSLISLYVGSFLQVLQAVPRSMDWMQTSFSVVGGTTYQISLDGYPQGGAGTQGTADYLLWLNGPAANDNFISRQSFTGLTNLVFGFNEWATAEMNEPNPLAIAAGKSIWYSWTAPISGRYEASAAASDFGAQSVLTVYTGGSLTNLNFITGAAGPGTTTFLTSAGTNYVFSIDTTNAQASGLARLTLRPLPPNDMFADRILVTGTNFTISGNNANATIEPGEALFGGGRTLWWSWTAPQSGRVNISLDTGDTAVRIYQGGSVSDLALVSTVPGNTSFTARSGEAFQIAVDTTYANRSYGFTLNQASAPFNNDFANAILLTGAAVSTNGSNIGATVEPGEPRFPDTKATSTIWWKWTAPVTGKMRINAKRLSVYGDLAENFGVYTGNTVSNLIPALVGTNVGSFAATAGTTYYICLDGTDGELGDLILDLAPTPVNDNFADRQILSGYFAQANGSSSGGTMEPGEGLHGIEPETASVWFTWTAPATGSLAINYTGNGFYASVSVYTGSELTNLTRLAMNNFNAAVNLPVTQGTTYILALAGWYGGGDYTLKLILDAGNRNDAFANRIALVGTNVMVTANNGSATKESGEPDVLNQNPSHSLWWTYTSPDAGSVRIDFGEVSFTPLVGIYTGNSLSTLKPVTNILDYIKRQIVFNVYPTTNYQISIDGYNDAVGSIFLKCDFLPAATNDAFTNRSLLVGDSISTTANNRGATEEPGEPPHAGLSGSHSLWWSWTAPADESITLAAEGDAFPARIAVYSGTTLKTLKPLASNYVGNLLLKDLTFVAHRGSNYQLAVDSDLESFGAISLTLNAFQKPSNDNFASAIPLHGARMFATGSNVGATTEPGEPGHDGIWPDHSVWWRWTADVNGPVTIDTFDSGFDTVLAVYRGTTLTNLMMVASNDDAAHGGTASEATFEADAGSTYFVDIDGFSGASGDIRLNLWATQPPALRITDVKLSQDGHFTFTIQGTPTQFFLLQTSTNLVTWETVSTNQCTTSVFQFAEPAVPNSEARFYRVAPIN